MSAIKKKKGRPRKNKGVVLAVSESANPFSASQQEILRIREKHRKMLAAARTMLPEAIEIGEWFNKARIGIGYGDWYRWLSTNFPEITPRTVITYMTLAIEKQFLTAKFNLKSEALPISNVADIEQLPSIRDAQKAIKSKRNPSKKEIKAQPPPIDVESESTPVESAESDNGSGERAMRVLPPAEVRVALAEQGTEVEPTSTPTETIEESFEQICSMLRSSLLLYQEALECARKHRIDNSVIRENVQAVFDDLSDLMSETDLKNQLLNLLR